MLCAILLSHCPGRHTGAFALVEHSDRSASRPRVDRSHLGCRADAWPGLRSLTVEDAAGSTADAEGGFFGVGQEAEAWRVIRGTGRFCAGAEAAFGGSAPRGPVQGSSMFPPRRGIHDLARPGSKVVRMAPGCPGGCCAGAHPGGTDRPVRLRRTVEEEHGFQNRSAGRPRQQRHIDHLARGLRVW